METYTLNRKEMIQALIDYNTEGVKDSELMRDLSALFLKLYVSYDTKAIIRTYNNLLAIKRAEEGLHCGLDFDKSR